MLSSVTNVAGKTVLIVDAEPDIAELEATIVAAAGFRPLVAHDGERTTEIMKSERIDALLLDIDLQCESGIRLCKAIRELDKAVPIIFVTGGETRASEAFAAGCDDVIHKPFERAILVARMKGLIERAHFAQQLKRTHEMLQHHVSRRTREVVALAAAGGTLPPTMQKEVTVMFTDVRRFTSLSEVMEPDALFSLLSSQLAAQVYIVHACGGYVDKFGGDGLMAVFDSADMARKACECALLIMGQAHVGTINDTALRQLGIGINKGKAIIGNIGSPEHVDYSVIGTTVNVAARLCGAASPMSIVVSGAVRDAAASDPALRFGDKRDVPIRGIQGTISVYTLLQPNFPDD